MPPSMLDVVTTTTGSPDSIIRGTKESMPLATPNTLTEKHQTQSFASCSHGRPPPPDVTPALLKRRWHAPSAANTPSASASTDAGDETSVTTPRTSPTSASSFTAVSRTGSSTSAMTTRTPSSSRASTMPRPTPPAPPVTPATRPLRSSNALPPVIETRVAAHVNAPAVTPPIGRPGLRWWTCCNVRARIDGPPEERDGRDTAEAVRTPAGGVGAARRDADGTGLAATSARQCGLQARGPGPGAAALAPVAHVQLARRDRRAPRLRGASLDPRHLRRRGDGHGVAAAHVRAARGLGVRRYRHLLHGRDRTGRRCPRSGRLVRPPLVGQPAPDDVALGRAASHRGDGAPRRPHGHHPGAPRRQDRALNPSSRSSVPGTSRRCRPSARPSSPAGP